MPIDPQKLPGVVPGDPRRPIPVLSSLNRSHEGRTSAPKQTSRTSGSSGFLASFLPRPLSRAIQTLFTGRRRGELSGKAREAEFFGPHGLLGEVWDDEMSSSRLSSRMKKVVQNYQVRTSWRGTTLADTEPCDSPV